MKEETSTTSGISMPATKVHTHGDNWKMFDVASEVFKKFETGRNRYERWSKYLDEDDDGHTEIKKYACKFPTNTIVLRDSNTGCLRQIRRRAAND